MLHYAKNPLYAKSGSNLFCCFREIHPRINYLTQASLRWHYPNQVIGRRSHLPLSLLYKLPSVDIFNLLTFYTSIISSAQYLFLQLFKNFTKQIINVSQSFPELLQESRSFHHAPWPEHLRDSKRAVLCSHRPLRFQA